MVFIPFFVLYTSHVSLASVFFSLEGIYVLNIHPVNRKECHDVEMGFMQVAVF